MNRYHRQILLPEIGLGGQADLADARVLLIGCGALGTVIAEHLVRGGVGFLRIVDRDIVELTNLQRQTLFDERDAAELTPKAIAAARRLSAVNSTVRIEAIVADVDNENIEKFAGVCSSPSPGTPGEGRGGGGPLPTVPELPVDQGRGQEGVFDLLLDGTDNVETRGLINDVAVKHKIDWVYAACVGMTGRVMPIEPGAGPCLRCVFEQLPGPGELPSCDTAGVFGPTAGIVGSLASAVGMRLLVTHGSIVDRRGWDMTAIDGTRFRTISVGAGPRPDCPVCGGRTFAYLNGDAGARATALCGQNAVQIRPAGKRLIMDLAQLEIKLRNSGTTRINPHLLRCELHEPEGASLTVFADGRAIVHGVSAESAARSVYARYVGA